MMKDMTDEKFNPTMNALKLESLNLIDAPASFLNFNFDSSASLRVLDLQVRTLSIMYQSNAMYRM
jgi:hypothetical protein